MHTTTECISFTLPATHCHCLIKCFQCSRIFAFICVFITKNNQRENVLQSNVKCPSYFGATASWKERETKITVTWVYLYINSLRQHRKSTQNQINWYHSDCSLPAVKIVHRKHKHWKLFAESAHKSRKARSIRSRMSSKCTKIRNVYSDWIQQNHKNTPRSEDACTHSWVKSRVMHALLILYWKRRENLFWSKTYLKSACSS